MTAPPLGRARTADEHHLYGAREWTVSTPHGQRIPDYLTMASEPPSGAGELYPPVPSIAAVAAAAAAANTPGTRSGVYGPGQRSNMVDRPSVA